MVDVIVAPMSLFDLSGITLLLAVTIKPFLGLMTLGSSFELTIPFQSLSLLVPSMILHPI